MAISKTGMWIDRTTGRVVDSEPVEATLLVSPGGEVTPQVQARIDRAGGPPEAPAEEQAEGDEDRSGDEPETAAVAPAPETAATSGTTGTKRGR